MHEQSLTKHAAELFPEFSRFQNFYLAGGTALALQIGHRLSVDFDFFTSGELPKDIVRRLKSLFPSSSISITYSSAEQLNVIIDEIQTTFLEYPYPLIDQPVSYKGISLASIQEIGAMKAFSIGKRLSYKDYVDWYFLLLEKHVNLGETIKFCQKKFGDDFNDRLFVGQLVSLEDISSQKIDFLRDSVDRETIQGFLRNEVKKFEI